MHRVEPLGPKIAEGRDSEIYDHGPGRVLRIARDGRSLEREAEVMRYVRSAGYPVPAVHDAGEGYLVMDRIDGPPMLDAATKPPFPIRRFGRMLAELHRRLHAIPAPDWLPEAPMPGDRIVHRDLHPLNVLISAEGPVVIDWANASRGDPAFDVADTWVLFAAANPDVKGFERLALPLFRRLFLRMFLAGVDRDAARRAIPAAVAHRLTDRNHTPEEHERMRALAEWASTFSNP
jgi:aminoglycoside phosphotransferase (APT) family kinase protein